MAGSGEQFFVNGGTRCFMTRGVPEDATVAEAKAGILNIRTADEGTYGDQIVQHVCDIQESIKASISWVVFEQNDQSLWARVSISISAILETMRRNGMLAGNKPEESYFVEVGPTTMTQEDIRSGRLICNIGIAPLSPAEFVIFQVTQHTSEAEE